ncbi:hypothetical protein VQ03_07410 [Methylobacterium tarhaniae]|uniref:Uncharacterized protein n=1 Tax=Methylobacterium tarhaniae TaxID=1187852 RepID=A0A0J6VWI7_9HYPH|nr:hypothetical protein VQ03_07410 [Methylobacterium tarhaniae]
MDALHIRHLLPATIVKSSDPGHAQRRTGGRSGPDRYRQRYVHEAALLLSECRVLAFGHETTVAIAVSALSLGSLSISF